MIKELNKNYKLKLIERFNENNELLKIIDDLVIIDVKYFNFYNETISFCFSFYGKRYENCT